MVRDECFDLSLAAVPAGIAANPRPWRDLLGWRIEGLLFRRF
jgi:hypothetical protein